nr:hypothetical protein [Prauserella aidingensis]
MAVGRGGSGLVVGPGGSVVGSVVVGGSVVVVGGGSSFTVTVAGSDVDAVQFPSPGYCAVIRCSPTAGSDVVSVGPPGARMR